jgi:polyhydroxyalkanoate synthesis regulator phasin
MNDWKRHQLDEYIHYKSKELWEMVRNGYMRPEEAQDLLNQMLHEMQSYAYNWNNPYYDDSRPVETQSDKDKKQLKKLTALLEKM